jgi:type IV secretion system protein VirD4
MEKATNKLTDFFADITGSACDVGIGIIQSLFSEKKTKFDADFLPVAQALSRFNKGFCLTGTRSITVKESYSNCSVYAPSGAGKSSVIVLPTIYNLSRVGSTIICNDPDGVLYSNSAAYLNSLGYIVLKVDFSNPEFSEKYNPLLRCKTVSDIQKVVHLILRNTLGETKGDPFWDRSAEMLTVLFARFLVFHASVEYRTFANVLRLVETFATSNKLDKIITGTGDEDLISQYKATLANGDKTLQSIISTARAALNIFSDPTIVQTTSSDTIDFTRFRKEKIALFLCNPIKDIHYYKPLSALFFENLFNDIMSRIPTSEENSIFCILEEAATMKFSSLGIAISNIRKFRAGIMLVVQDYQALVSLYGQAEAHNIRTNTYAQVFLPGQPLETCKELEAILGKFTYKDEETGIEKVRPLLTADECRIITDAIILLGNRPAIRAKMTPYYERYALKMRSELPHIQSAKKQAVTPPIFPIDEP